MANIPHAFRKQRGYRQVPIKTHCARRIAEIAEAKSISFVDALHELLVFALNYDSQFVKAEIVPFIESEEYEVLGCRLERLEADLFSFKQTLASALIPEA